MGISRLPAQRKLQTKIVKLSAKAILRNSVAALLVLAFTGMVVHPNLIPPLFKTWGRGDSKDATGKYLPFTFCSEEGSLTDVYFVYSDSNEARTLAVPTNISWSYGLITVENCVNKCNTLGGYAYAGLEVAVECCTSCQIDKLSSPDQTSLLKGVAMV